MALEAVDATCSHPRMFHSSSSLCHHLILSTWSRLSTLRHQRPLHPAFPMLGSDSRCALSICSAQPRPSVILQSVLNGVRQRRVTPMVAHGLDSLKPLRPFRRKCFTTTSHRALIQLIVSNHVQKRTFILTEFHFLSSRTRSQPKRPFRVFFLSTKRVTWHHP